MIVEINQILNNINFLVIITIITKKIVVKDIMINLKYPTTQQL